MKGEKYSARGLYLKHEALELSEDFVMVSESKDIGPSNMKAKDVNGEKLHIINIEDNIMQFGLSAPIWVDP